jgi:hypothetical protein
LFHMMLVSLCLTPEVKESIESLKSIGQFERVKDIQAHIQCLANCVDYTYHYLPYRMDSDFEKKFLAEVLTLKDFRRSSIRNLL